MRTTRPPPASTASRFSATVHCLSGCATGEILGLVIGTALALSNGATIALSIALAFFFGYAFTSWPLLRSGMALGAVIPLALASDTLSIATMEVVDTLIVLVIPGAMDAGLGEALFWGSLALRAADRGHRGLPGQPLAAEARQRPRARARRPRSLSARTAADAHAAAALQRARQIVRGRASLRAPDHVSLPA